jgi:hypothetical protein
MEEVKNYLKIIIIIIIMSAPSPPPELRRDLSDSLSITSRTSNGSNFSRTIIALANDPIGTIAAAGGAALPCSFRCLFPDA